MSSVVILYDQGEIIEADESIIYNPFPEVPAPVISIDSDEETDENEE